MHTSTFDFYECQFMSPVDYNILLVKTLYIVIHQFPRAEFTVVGAQYLKFTVLSCCLLASVPRRKEDSFLI
jgi:hypothetical protein